MISKRLAYLLVVVVGVACAMFVYKTNSTFFEQHFETGDMRTYNYNSMLLRMAKGKARIKGKSGYIAYEGNVEGGYVNGDGTLYYKDGNVCYTGAFAKSMYEGEGILYYDNGNLEYKGSFSKNLYNGTGDQYRQTGSLLYSGDFVNGLKEGNGELFDNGGNKVYSGRFSKDFLLYSELLGKTASEVNDSYTGKLSLYSDDETFAVYLSDIGAIYAGTENNDALESETVVETVYVLDSEFPVREGKASTISEVIAYLGEPIFEGTSYMTEEEAVATSIIREATGDRYFEDPGLVTEYVYDDYCTIDSYNTDKMVYLYTFLKDGIEYNFVCENPNSYFGFYYMRQEEGSANSDDEEAL